MKVMRMTKRSLILEDGTIFTGEAFGSEEASQGEVIFYAGMTGYQEILTDPNYNGTIVTMTYPLIGNYGINRDDFESISPYVEGVVVKELSDEPSNFRSEESLGDFLSRQNIPGIAGIDTRKLTRLIRQNGTMRGVLTAAGEAGEHKDSLFSNWEQRNLVDETSITRPYIVPGRGMRITVIDLGMKHSILHELTERQCNVTVVPYNYSAKEILQFKPDGVLISNGPGNPEDVTVTVDTIKELLGEIPIFGIGLGHQLLALANGAKIQKLHVGNYGKNYAVRELKAERTWSTTQSRHYFVEEESLAETDLEVTFRSANDGTIEGLQHKTYPVMSVQFNPEGAPGSDETNFLFDEFLQLIEQTKTEGGGA